MTLGVPDANVRLLFNAQCMLGESPVWDSECSALYFVDIKAKSLNVWKANKIQKYPLSSETGSIVLCDGGGLLAAQLGGFAYIKLDPFEEINLAIAVKDRVGNRFNDGKCDPTGKFWVASMDNECIKETGSIWSLDKRLTLKNHAGGFSVGNGFGWSKDVKRMYFTDSQRREILWYEFDSTTGRLGKKHCFAKIPSQNGYPDGLAVDVEDFIWSAHWDGGRITRYAPDGTVDRIIEMPIPRPTSIAFGGADRKTLFVTSARYGLTNSELEQFPLSGGIFAIDVDVAGELPTPFALQGHYD